MKTCKKLSLLVCLFLIINQNTIGNKRLGNDMFEVTNVQEDFHSTEAMLRKTSNKGLRFLDFPHTAIYTK